MKIRTDFVTNSSSSSFITFLIKNKELVDISRKFSLPVNIDDSKTISGVMNSESTECIGTPYRTSIAEWFKDLLNTETNGFMWSDFTEIPNEVFDYIDQHEDQINASTEYSYISKHDIVSDDYGSGIAMEKREKGKIKTAYIDEDDWTYEEQGIALWEVLEGACEDEMWEFAKKNDLIRSASDPWYKEKDPNSIFDSFSPSDSIDGKKCCLTGDFSYGSKSKVEEYISSKGGEVKSSVTKATDILIVGAVGSKNWTHNNYGSKVEKALSLKGKGSSILIVKEKDLIQSDS